MDKAIIVGLITPDLTYDIKYSMDELESLVSSLDIRVYDAITQKLDKPNPATYVGKGKVDEIKMAINSYDANVVIFNDELTPAQIRNLTTELDIEVMDRSYIILQIFEQRAQTTEAQLEIKLAQDRYLLPRISSMNRGLSRQGGSSGSQSSKGTGEKQSELSRRYISNEIVRLTKELERIKQMKVQQIEKRKRNEVPIVALVGYTNAGKSSTMNTIINTTSGVIEKNVYEKDELFATLQTFNRKIEYKKQTFILVDTIGFVSKLPHHLVSSFRQTLEEIKHADLLIHVVDISSQYFEEQLNVTNSVIASLNCENIPMLYLLNKYDKYDDENTVLSGVENMKFSNKLEINHDELLNYIVEKIKPRMFDAKILVPYNQGKLLNFIENNAQINSKVYMDNGVYLDIEISQRYYNDVALYEIDNIVQ